MPPPSQLVRILAVSLILVLAATAAPAIPNPTSSSITPATATPHKPDPTQPPQPIPFLAAPELLPGSSYFTRIPALDPNTRQLLAEATAALAANQPAEAERTLTQALPTLSERTQAESRAHVLRVLGTALREQGRWPEAEQRFRQALALFERTQSPHVVSLGLCLREIALALSNENRAPEAEAPARQALTILTGELGENDPDTLAAIDVLSGILLTRAKFTEAQATLQPAIVAAEGSGLAPAYLHGRLLSKLGIALTEQRRYGEAAPDLQTAVSLFDSIVLPPNRDLAVTLFWLAHTFNALQNPEQAEPQVRRALQLLDQFPHSELEWADGEHILGEVFYAEGHYHEAVDAFSHAYDLHKRLLGADHANTIESLFMYGASLCLEDQCARAEPLLRKALSLQERVRPNSTNAADIAEKLGMTLYRQGKYRAAQQTYAHALSIRTSLLGAADPHTVHVKIDVAFAAYQQGKLADARAMLVEALETEARTRRSPDLFVAQAQERLGEILDSQGDVAMAARCFKAALDIYRQLKDSTDEATGEAPGKQRTAPLLKRSDCAVRSAIVAHKHCAL